MIKLQFPLNITLHSPRPIFKAYINNVKITCMLDTGADIPVFCKGLDLFKEYFINTENITPFKKSLLGGFGKDKEDTVLYNIPSVQLADTKESLIYHNMKIAVVLKPAIPCDLILSASLFTKMKYTIDCLGNNHYLLIEANRATYGVGFYNPKDTIYIFAEDNDKIHLNSRQLGKLSI